MTSSYESDAPDDLFDDAWVESDEPPPVPEDAAGVTRLLRAVRHMERQIEWVGAKVDPEIERLTSWRDEQQGGLRRRIAQVERAIENWMRDHAKRNPRVRTEKFSDGELRLRPRQVRLEVVDSAAAIEWAKANKHAAWLACPPAPPPSIQRTVAKAEVVPGPKAVAGPAQADDGYEWRQALVGDEIVPGLLLHVPVEVDQFSYNTTKGDTR